MPESDRINEAIRVESLDLPPKPRVVRLAWELDEDSSGDDALEILVLFDDQTTDEEIEKAPIQEIKWKIIERLERHNVKLFPPFPYFVFARESEQEMLRGEQ